MESNSYTLVILANFQRKFPFCGKGQFGQKLCNLMICSLRIFLKLCSMMGYKRPMLCWSTFPTNSVLVDRANPNLGQHFATFSDDFLSEIFFKILLSDRHTKVIVNLPGKYILGKMGNLAPI